MAKLSYADKPRFCGLVTAISKSFQGILAKVQRQMRDMAMSSFDKDLPTIPTPTRLWVIWECMKEASNLINEVCWRYHSEPLNVAGGTELFPYVALYFLSPDERVIEYVAATDGYGLKDLGNHGEAKDGGRHSLWEDRSLDWQAKGIEYGTGVMAYFLRGGADPDEVVSFDPRDPEESKKYNYKNIRAREDPQIVRQLSVALTGLSGELHAILTVETPYLRFSDVAGTDRCIDFEFVRDVLSVIGNQIEMLLTVIREYSLNVKVTKMHRYLEEFSRFDLSSLPGSLETVGSQLGRIFGILKDFVDGEEMFVLPRYGPQLMYDSRLDRRGEDSAAQYKAKVVPRRLLLWTSEVPEKGQGLVIRSAEDRRTYYLPHKRMEPLSKLYWDVDDSTVSQLTIPMILQERLLGVMDVSSPHPFAFMHTERKIFSLFSRIATLLLFQSQGALEFREQLLEIGMESEKLGMLNDKLLRIGEEAPNRHIEASTIRDLRAITKTLYNFTANVLGISHANRLTVVQNQDENLFSVVDTAIARLAPLAMERYKVTLELAARTVRDAHVCVSKEAVEVVLKNFIDNAVLATRDADIRVVEVLIESDCIKLGTLSKMKEHAGFWVCVRDTGKGMNIFDLEPKWRAPDPAERWENLESIRRFRPLEPLGNDQHFEGRGLWLWINDQIISRFYGRLKILRLEDMRNEVRFFVPSDPRALGA